MKGSLIFVLFLALLAKPAQADAAVELSQTTLGNIFIEGETVAIPVRADGDSLRWSIHDFFGAEVASGNSRLSGGAAVIQPRIEGPGYFTLDVTAERGGQEAGKAETVLAIVPKSRPANEKSPFGVMTHFAKGWATDIIPLIEKAGIRRVRDEQPWRKIEKERGQYDFPPQLTAYMSELAAHHIDPLVVLAFANPLYDNGQTPYSDDGRAGYAAYARAVAKKYGPDIHAVEVWNEYSGKFCEGPCRSDRPGFYASMQQEAYKMLKAADPSLTVAGAAAVPIPLDYFRGLFEKGALASMDAVVIHPYRGEPEGVEQDIEALHQMMARSGTPKPIWATEFGDIADMRKSRDDVARYLVRMSTLLLSEKVERIYWYLMCDYQEFAGLGLVRDENDTLGRYTPTPSYVAYATLIHELDGLTFVRREQSDPRTRIYLFAGDDGEVRVAWSALPGAAFDVAGNEPVRIVTMMGGEKSIMPKDGRISIALDRNPVYVIGKAALAAERSAAATAQTAPGSGGGAAASVAGAGADGTASSLDDFSVEQGKKGWSYGAIVRPDGPIAVGSAVSEPFEPLQPNENGDGWRRGDIPTLKIKSAMMHPGRFHKASAWAVRRWSSPAAGAVRVTGTVQLNDKKSDGVTFALLVNGRAAYVAELGGSGASNKADFDVPVTVERGTTVDFAVGPGPDGGINFDATHLSAFIGAAGKR